MKRYSLLALISVLFALSLLPGCGYNTMQANEEAVKAAWGDVESSYQRRADLVPNLVNTVKGYAAHEREVLTRVTEARAKVGSLAATPELVNDPEAFARFQAAQGELTSALSRLLVVAENYPNLKADAGFRDLQAQLEGTENRINVARLAFNEAVREYNAAIEGLPARWIAQATGDARRAYFEVDPGVRHAPVLALD